VEGIARWWLDRARAPALAAVEQAVELLLARGYILETRRSGVPPYYQANPQALVAIAEFLEANDAWPISPDDSANP
jgi:hypothetical protein